MKLSWPHNLASIILFCLIKSGYGYGISDKILHAGDPSVALKTGNSEFPSAGEKRAVTVFSEQHLSTTVPQTLPPTTTVPDEPLSTSIVFPSTWPATTVPRTQFVNITGQITEHTPHTIVQQSKSCGCGGEEHFLGVWLDIVFVLDTSSAVHGHIFQIMKTFIHQIGLHYKIGKSEDNSKQYSRVAIVNTGNKAQRMADFQKYKNGTELSNDIENISMIGGVLDPIEGLSEARKIIEESSARGERLNVHKVVVLFSSVDIICNKQKGKDNSKACRTAQKMRINGTQIMTVSLRNSEGILANIDIADRCLRFQYDRNMVEDIVRGLCLENCYCQIPYTQLGSADECIKYAECYMVSDIALSYDGAKMVCAASNGTLPDFAGPEKDNFLNELHKDKKAFPYWNGMRKINGKLSYGNGTLLEKEAYRNWCNEKNQTENSNMDCIYADHCTDSRPGWFNDKCGKIIPTHFFSCQKDACTVDKYCE